MKKSFACCLLSLVVTCSLITFVSAEDAAKPVFKVGFAKRDVTPKDPMPMWGYGARHAMLSQGMLDPLQAKIVVIEAGKERLAIVGWDIGRGPTEKMMEKIRKEIKEKAGVGHVMISGSHSHHGPVLELSDRPGFGKGKFDAAVKYIDGLADVLIGGIVEAAGKLQPAKIGVGTKNVTYNRNRHTKRPGPKVTDPMLAVIRFDSLEGKPLAFIVNFAAHPVMTDTKILKFSADYPGALMNEVEKTMNAPCVFMQGASGDMSPNSPPGVSGPQQFGTHVGKECVAIAREIKTEVPEKPSIQGRVDKFEFPTRINMGDPLVMAAFSYAFFPELVQNFVEEFRDGLRPELNTIVLNKDLALVGGSGEFFCNHANRLKERAYIKNTLFFGYCNGHHMYFPTIEAVSEGGYGADSQVSQVEIGGGEKMMNRALINIYTMLGLMQEGKEKLPLLGGKKK